jgi:hypothetical protein
MLQLFLTKAPKHDNIKTIFWVLIGTKQEAQIL